MRFKFKINAKFIQCYTTVDYDPVSTSQLCKFTSRDRLSACGECFIHDANHFKYPMICLASNKSLEVSGGSMSLPIRLRGEDTAENWSETQVSVWYRVSHRSTSQKSIEILHLWLHNIHNVVQTHYSPRVDLLWTWIHHNEQFLSSRFV